MSRRRLLILAAECWAAACMVLPAVAQPSSVTGIEWLAEEVLDTALPAGAVVSLVLDGNGRAAGHSGCNRFTGGVTIGDGTLRFGLLAGTRMACPPPLAELEQQVLRALAETRLFTIDASRSKLRLRDEAGATLMVLSR